MAKCINCGRKGGMLTAEYKLIPTSDTMLCGVCYDKIEHLNQGLKQLNNESEVHDQMELVYGEAKKANFNVDTMDYLKSYEAHLCQVLKEAKMDQGALNFEDMLCSTTPTLQGYDIEEYLGIVSGSVALGSGFFSEYTAGWSDFFGTEAEAFSEKMSEAEKMAFTKVYKKAINAGANGLVGVDIEHTMFASNMIGVNITATAVCLVKKEKASE